MSGELFISEVTCGAKYNENPCDRWGAGTCLSGGEFLGSKLALITLLLLINTLLRAMLQSHAMRSVSHSVVSAGVPQQRCGTGTATNTAIVSAAPSAKIQHRTANRGAFQVRAQAPAVVDVEKASSKKKSLAANMGGAPAVRAAVDVFYGKMLADPRVSFFFDGIDMKAQRGHQVAFLTFAMGGSDRYDGNANMTTAHARLVRDMGMNMEHFDVTLQHLASALQELGLSQELIDEAAETVETLRPAFQMAVDEYTPRITLN